MTKVDIISGFLGAGKTTFIKKLIGEVFLDEKIVLIENEFGEIGIDGGFLKDAGVEITEMNSGCICCTLVGDFSRALQKVLKEHTPDRVIIEPSGVGKLSDIVRAVQDVKEEADIEIGSLITVVDGRKAGLYLKNFGEFFQNQVEHASTIVMSRTQMMEDDKIEACVKMLRQENADAPVITTRWDVLGGNAIQNALSVQKGQAGLLDGEHLHSHRAHACSHGHGHHTCSHSHEEHPHPHSHGENCGCEEHHHADEVFTSWSCESAHRYTEEELDYAVKALAETEGYGIVLRAKGIVQMTDGTWRQFDLVPEEYEIRPGQPDYSGRLCVIGTDLREAELEKLFHV